MQTLKRPRAQRTITGDLAITFPDQTGRPWQIITIAGGIYFGIQHDDGKWSPTSRFYFGDSWRVANGHREWTIETLEACIGAFLSAGSAE